MAEREPWERNDNPEPWTRPDKAAPWLRKQKDQEPWDRSATPESQAINTLRSSENNAISSREPSYYRGGNNKIEDDNPTQPKAKGKKKGIGALIAIIMALAGGGAFLSSSNSLLAGALNSLTTISTQTSYTSYTLRARNITKNMLNNYGGGIVTNNRWTGQVKYSTIPNYMRKRFAKYGIEVTGSGSNTRMSWNGIDDINAEKFLNMYNNDVEFREAFTNAKRGRVATFFDNIADKIYKKLGLSRNVFSGYEQTGNAEVDDANYKSTASNQFNKGRATIRTAAEDGQATDENGNLVYERDGEGHLILDENNDPIPVRDDIESSGSSTSGSATSEADATSKASGMIADVAGRVAAVGGLACTFMKIGSSIAMTAAAMEMYQSITYFMSQLESPSKMMAGYGNQSPINAFLNLITTRYTAEVEDYAHTPISFLGKDTSQAVPTIDQSGAAVESGGLLAMLSGATGAQAVNRTKNYSIERIIVSMGGAAMFGIKATQVCDGVSATQSLISIATAIGTAGASVVSGFFTNLAKSAALQITVSAALGFLIPTVAKILFSNVFDTTNGIPAGEMLARGAAAANMREGRSGSGQAPSNRDAVLAFNQSTKQVLALEAEQDRARLSPFDTSNPNTFFGSIAYSLLPTITSTNMTGLASFLRSTTSSLSSIINRGVSADGEGSSYLTTFGECPLLDEIDVVGDMYCNPIVTTDMSTIDIESNPQEYDNYTNAIADSMDSCDAEGNCTIDKDSDLAHYITYCDGRDSPFGVVDQNILSAFEVGNFALNSIPLVSDVIDLINVGIHEANIDWATGANCVSSSGGSISANNPAANNSFWNTKGKYYQRYIEDQRILEQMGAYEGSKNPVVAYEKAYEKEHPLDNTYIGYLSRISGLTPENTETVLAFIEYYTFVEEYDPTLRIALDEVKDEEKSGEQIATEIINSRINLTEEEYIANPIETNIPSREHIIYFDLRNRSYVA